VKKKVIVERQLQRNELANLARIREACLYARLQTT
jgi:hypothetical protein